MALMKHQQVAVIRRQTAFLEAFETCGVINAAAKSIGIDPRTHYNWMKNSPEYREKFAEVEPYAEGALRDMLVAEVVRRAIEGKSDTLLIFATKRYIPEFRDVSRQEIQQTVTHNGPVEIKVVQDENWYGNANLISAEGTPQPNTAAAIACEIQSPGERPALGKNGLGPNGSHPGPRP